MVRRRKQKKLNNRIILRCIMMAAAICSAVCVSGFFQYRNSTFKTYNDFGYQICGIARGYVDGDTIGSYLETGTPDEQYNKMAEQLYYIYKSSGCGSIYVTIIDVENRKYMNVYDVRVEDTKDYDTYAIGARNEICGSPDEVIKVFQTGVRSNDYYIRKNNFGYNTSAILPVFDSNNKVTALTVVDIPMDTIQGNLMDYFVVTVSLTAVIMSVFIVSLHFMLKRTVIKPINLIADEAAEFVKSDQTFSHRLCDIRTNDEIENLANSVLKMEVEINSYIEHITNITAEKERLGAELNVATKIQASMLPCIFPPYPERNEFDVYATMTPAKEVGGDFYDFYMIDSDHFAMVMADVSGKGVAAALYMVIAKTIIKNFSQIGSVTPDLILRVVNNRLCENNIAEMFVTAWLGIVELSTGKLTAANAGHEFPVIKHKNGDFEIFKDKHGFVLAGMEGTIYTPYEIQLEKGDRLYLYTDGVTEAVNRDDELFGSKRMLEALNEKKDGSLNELLENVQRRINEFAGNTPQFDDITMMAFDYNGTDAKEENMKEIVLDATVENIDRVTDFVNEQLEDSGCSMKIITQFDIAIDEIFSNIANYAYAPEKGTAAVRVAVDDNVRTAAVTFMDSGVPYDPLEKDDPDVTLSAEERQIGGLGIFVVKKTMDEVAYEYKDGKNVLKIVKKF